MLRNQNLGGELTSKLSNTELQDEYFMMRVRFDGGRGPAATGAQRSFDHPNGDGPRNLQDAVALIKQAQPGVFIQFGGMSIPARRPPS